MTYQAQPENGPIVEDTYLPRRLGLFEFLRSIREDGLSIIAPENFERNLVHNRLLFLNVYRVLKPEYIEHVLLTNQKNYPKHRVLRNMLGPVLGEGLLLSEGDHWRRQRRIAAPAFQHNRIAGLVDLMAEETQAMVERWRNIDQPFDVAEEMMTITFTIISRAMFSIDVANDVETVRRLMTHMISTRPSFFDMLGLPQWIPRFTSRGYRKMVAEFDALVARIIGERRNSGADHGDLLSMMLAARDPETDMGMSDKQLRDEILTIMLAGHETTANALSWCWWLLAEHPEAEAKLHAELARVLGGRAPRREDIPQLKYTRMVIEEALRLYPPVFIIPRIAVNEDWIGGVQIKPGSTIIIYPYITHRNPNLWPEPDRFIPERFDPESGEKRHRFAYLPFGGGPRVCIGNGLALTEAVVILATLAQRYNLRLAPGQEVKPTGLLTLRPKKGILVTALKSSPRRAEPASLRGQAGS